MTKKVRTLWYMFMTGRQSVPYPLREMKSKMPLPITVVSYNLFDVENDTNNLVTYRNGKLEVLISNFEIKGQVVQRNLLLHGYDRRQKKDSLYRFDGKNIYLIADNFAMGHYVIFNDKLVINKYDD